MKAMTNTIKPEAVTAFGSIYDHLMVVEKCAPLGIHVMVEKPLAVSMEHALKMEALAKQQKGFIGIDSAKNEVGITVSYWENLDAIKNWKTNTEHLFAQQKGREQWYNWYNVKICKVEREYEFLK